MQAERQPTPKDNHLGVQLEGGDTEHKRKKEKTRQVAGLLHFYTRIKIPALGGDMISVSGSYLGATSTTLVAFPRMMGLVPTVNVGLPGTAASI